MCLRDTQIQLQLALLAYFGQLFEKPCMDLLFLGHPVFGVNLFLLSLVGPKALQNRVRSGDAKKLQLAEGLMI